MLLESVRTLSHSGNTMRLSFRASDTVVDIKSANVSQFITLNVAYAALYFDEVEEEEQIVFFFNNNRALIGGVKVYRKLRSAHGIGLANIDDVCMGWDVVADHFDPNKDLESVVILTV